MYVFFIKLFQITNKILKDNLSIKQTNRLLQNCFMIIKVYNYKYNTKIYNTNNKISLIKKNY